MPWTAQEGPRRKYCRIGKGGLSRRSGAAGATMSSIRVREADQVLEAGNTGGEETKEEPLTSAPM